MELVPETTVPLPAHLEAQGQQLLQATDSLYADLSRIVDHPVFQNFYQQYLVSWSSTRCVTHLMRLYAKLDDLSPKITDPFEKLALLQDLIVRDWVTEDGSCSMVHPEADLTLRTAESFSTTTTTLSPVPDVPPITTLSPTAHTLDLRRHSSVFRDVVDVMEHEHVRAFLDKYFLRWDIGDFIVVLIRLYKCLDRFPTWTVEQKMGFLHHVLSDPSTRHNLARKITEWKAQP